MSATEFDDSKFPLVIATPIDLPTADEFEIFLVRLEGYLARGRHAVVLDATRGGPLPPVLRRRQAEWCAQRAAILALRCAGFCVVVTNPLVRGTITAINWLQPPAYPFKVVSTRAEGLAWCRKQLDAAVSVV